MLKNGTIHTDKAQQGIFAGCARCAPAAVVRWQRSSSKGNFDMYDNETEDAWAGENTSRSGEEGLRGVVLAQLPDLQEEEQDIEGSSPARREGRLLSARLSRRLLVGAGLLLVLVAVVPFLFNGSGGDWQNRRPAPNADLAPVYDTSAVPATTEQSAQSGSVPQESLPTYDASSEGGMKIDIPDIPKIPGLGMQSPSAHRPSAEQAGRHGTTAPALQRYPRADANRARSLGGQSPAVADYRSIDQSASRRIELPLQPGVARLEGTIEKITHRPTYDKSRPGVY